MEFEIYPNKKPFTSELVMGFMLLFIFYKMFNVNDLYSSALGAQLLVIFAGLMAVNLIADASKFLMLKGPWIVVNSEGVRRGKKMFKWEDIAGFEKDGFRYFLQYRKNAKQTSARKS